ncbi:alpha/beta hydrolase [Thermaerobacillus caldiproteolyticus]|uniref:alpha/beta hydrolase n=1 Tax=Thermaerobacillus caldiproteolyticus TaxID=247480 RepID=UPI00188C713D|nr:alpha/beta hydrolase [Anoxybacillus caldiproteolyticus]QPA32830.1 alpha/beta hydrolase [Anoxybacillus caldiproteolyticus]
MLLDKERSMSTIEKTLLTAKFIDGFWDRWIVHGVKREDIIFVRSSLSSKEDWMKRWGTLADLLMQKAEALPSVEAEIVFRTAGLYYHLMQWLIPERNDEKKKWLNQSLKAVRIADDLSHIETHYVQLDVDQKKCFGRVCIPSAPKGIIIIINPLDSTKEELFTYEMDFLEKRFVTISFDGPGQGETYVFSSLKGTKKRWEKFVNLLIEFASSNFSLPIYVFGTSSGASWAVYSSCHPKVVKAVAVSPAFLSEEISLPDYFTERVRFVSEQEDKWLPCFEKLAFRNPVLLIHGRQDVMVSSEDIYNLYQHLPNGKKLLEFDDEGHCCNYKLPEIRQYAMTWFQEK